MLGDRLHKMVINEAGITSLIIEAITRTDAGHYTCIARNRAGEDRCEVELKVTGRPTCMSARLEIRNEN